MSRLYPRRIWIGTQNGLCIPVFGRPIFSFSSSLGFSFYLYLAALLAWLGPSSIYLILLYVHPLLCRFCSGFLLLSCDFIIGCEIVVDLCNIRLLGLFLQLGFGVSVLFCAAILPFNLIFLWMLGEISFGWFCLNETNTPNCCGFVISVLCLRLFW